jgi:hypothetical protein
MVIRLWSGQLSVWCWILGKGKILSSHRIQTVGPTKLLSNAYFGVCYSRVRHSGLEVDHSPPGVKTKKEKNG